MSLQLEDVIRNAEGPASRHGFRCWADLGQDTRVEWQIKHIIERQSLGLIFGPSGSGKTFLTFHLLASVAREVPFFGQKTSKGTVLYVAAEGGRSGDRRKRAYVEHHGLLTPIPFFQSDVSPSLLEPQEVQDFITRAKMLDPAIIAIDTLNRATPGGDESASRDMGMAIRSADMIREQTGAAVLLVHHTGKDATKGARGHSSLFAACDTVMEVESGENGHIARIIKARDGETGREMPFRLEVVTLGEDEDGDAITSCIVVPSELVGARYSKRGRLPELADLILKAIELAVLEAPETPPERVASVASRSVTMCTSIGAAKRYAEQLGHLDRSGPDATYRSRWFRGIDPLKKRGIIEVWGEKICVIG